MIILENVQNVKNFPEGISVPEWVSETLEAITERSLKVSVEILPGQEDDTWDVVVFPDSDPTHRVRIDFYEGSYGCFRSDKFVDTSTASEAVEAAIQWIQSHVADMALDLEREADSLRWQVGLPRRNPPVAGLPIG